MFSDVIGHFPTNPESWMLASLPIRVSVAEEMDSMVCLCGSVLYSI